MGEPTLWTANRNLSQSRGRLSQALPRMLPRRPNHQNKAINGAITAVINSVTEAAWLRAPDIQKLQTTACSVMLLCELRNTAAVSSRYTSSAVHSHTENSVG